MSLIEINIDEIEAIRKEFEDLKERRIEHNKRLTNLLDNLTNVESSGFVEEIVSKIEEHIDDVEKSHVGNLEYSSNFLKAFCEDFAELDKNTIK